MGGNQDGTTGSGKLGAGSPGAAGDPNSTGSPGGGGGYYGGAGGQVSAGGGGGSGFGPAGTAFQTDVHAGNGQVIITDTSGDTTPPTASPTQSPPANAAGRAATDVTVTWNWAENPGGARIDPKNCTQSTTSGGEGTLTLTAACDDLAGNPGKASYAVKVDKTAPTNVAGAPTGAPNANGRYDANVTVHYTCQDNLSGLAGGAARPIRPRAPS